MVETFRLLQEGCLEELDEVASHLERTYVLGRIRGRGRQRPRYPIETWNLYERVISGLPRTNNTCEAWNRRFNAILGKQHPNIWEFLTVLCTEEQYAESKRTLISLGNEPPRKRLRYRQNDDRIERIVLRYSEYIEAQEGLLDGDWNNGLLKYVKTLGYSARRVLE